MPQNLLTEPAAVEPHPSAPALEFVRPGPVERSLALVAVIVPFLGLLAATSMLWGRGFNWLYLGLLLGGYILTAGRITIGYHRLFTHRSFKTGPLIKGLLAILGSMSMQGPVLRWVATHRLHHQHSDDTYDPHSPHAHGRGLVGMLKGIWHAHIGWFFTPAPANMARYVADFRDDRVVNISSKLFIVWVLLGVAIPAAIAYAVTGTAEGALLGFLWGGLVRIFLVHHVTWSINSVCHIWGSRPFRSHDESRNNAIFGILALGEGWHNTHHAFPTSARHGLRWWEIDLSYFTIRGLALVGLASDIRIPSRDRIEAKRRVPGKTAAEIVEAKPGLDD